MPRPEPSPRPTQSGFSLVELLIAVLFMGILMAGLANVFKASLGYSIASTEKTSSLRQNRLALEEMFQDLNLAGLTPSALFGPPAGLASWPATCSPTSANPPPFCILPNQAYANTNVPGAQTAVNGGQYVQAVGDQLFLYYDQILPYTSTAGAALLNSSQDVANNATLATALSAAGTLQLNFTDSTQMASAANDFTTSSANGQAMVLMPRAVSQPLTVTALSSTGLATFSTGSTNAHGVPSGSVVDLIIPAIYIRYSIQPQRLDPSTTVQTPCLMRDVIPYPTSSAPNWAAPISSTIVAENVTGFHLGLSANGGQTWVGIDPVTNLLTTANPAWPISTNTDADTVALNAQLAAANANGTVQGSPFWFRNYPLLVRMDIQTRTMKSRAEYKYNTTDPGDYNYQTRSVIITPRNFGLYY